MNLLDKVEELELTADQFGFRWETTAQIMAQIKSECLEIEEHLHGVGTDADKAELQNEIGDLLHAVFSLCVFCKLSPEETLKKTLGKFEKRLNAVQNIAEQQGLKNLEGHSFEQLMRIWDKAKALVG